VGHAPVILGDSIPAGVTAILPHGGNLLLDRVPAAIHVGNGFGKLLGMTPVAEPGELETPILLTCTLCVWTAADALVDALPAQPGTADALQQPCRGDERRSSSSCSPTRSRRRTSPR
jgi:D-aminopeptidase